MKAATHRVARVPTIGAETAESLRELIRLIRDLDHEKQAAVNGARTGG